MLSSFNKNQTCGRIVTKPDTKTTKEDEVLLEENIPLVQQVENLRTKLSLQERYNAAIKDNLEENTRGQNDLFGDRIAELDRLRYELTQAINKERWAVNNALRTHRNFQMTLSRTPAWRALEWMDDKLFDNAKLLNELVDRLIQKRKKMEEGESSVSLLEKWPVPGSLPWEVKVEDELKHIQVQQCNMKFNLECSKLLYVKYKEIRQRLNDEQYLYPPMVTTLNHQLGVQKQELQKLEDMLEDAKKFEQSANATLQQTEREASANRKIRRAQFAHMKQQMHRLVQEERESFVESTDQLISSSTDKERSNRLFSMLGNDDARKFALEKRMELRKSKIETYNDTAAMLVDTMKIPNLTYIPRRLKEVVNLKRTLTEEIQAKEELKTHLINQKGQLIQLHCVIRYTGASELEQTELVIQDYQKSLDDVEKVVASKREEVNRGGELIADIKLGVNTLLQRLEEPDTTDQAVVHQVNIHSSEHVTSALPIFHDKLDSFCKELQELRETVHVPEHIHKQMRRALGQYPAPTPARFLRVNIFKADEASDEEFIDDVHVPGRADIKAQSQKVFDRGMLRLAVAKQAKGKPKSRKNHGSSLNHNKNKPLLSNNLPSLCK